MALSPQGKEELKAYREARKAQRKAAREERLSGGGIPSADLEQVLAEDGLITLKERNDILRAQRSELEQQLQAPELSQSAIRQERKETLTPFQRFVGAEKNKTEAELQREALELELDKTKTQLGIGKAGSVARDILTPAARIAATTIEQQRQNKDLTKLARALKDGEPIPELENIQIVNTEEGDTRIISSAYNAAPIETKFFGNVYAFGAKDKVRGDDIVARGRLALARAAESGEDVTSSEIASARRRTALQTAGGVASVAADTLSAGTLSSGAKLSFMTAFRSAGVRGLIPAVKEFGRLGLKEGLINVAAGVGQRVSEGDSFGKVVLGAPLDLLAGGVLGSATEIASITAGRFAGKFIDSTDEILSASGNQKLNVIDNLIRNIEEDVDLQNPIIADLRKNLADATTQDEIDVAFNEYLRNKIPELVADTNFKRQSLENSLDMTDAEVRRLQDQIVVVNRLNDSIDVLDNEIARVRADIDDVANFGSSGQQKRLADELSDLLESRSKLADESFNLREAITDELTFKRKVKEDIDVDIVSSSKLKTEVEKSVKALESEKDKLVNEKIAFNEKWKELQRSIDNQAEFVEFKKNRGDDAAKEQVKLERLLNQKDKLISKFEDKVTAFNEKITNLSAKADALQKAEVDNLRVEKQLAERIESAEDGLRTEGNTTYRIKDFSYNPKSKRVRAEDLSVIESAQTETSFLLNDIGAYGTKAISKSERQSIGRNFKVMFDSMVNKARLTAKELSQVAERTNRTIKIISKNIGEDFQKVRDDISEYMIAIHSLDVNKVGSELAKADGIIPDGFKVRTPEEAQGIIDAFTAKYGDNAYVKDILKEYRRVVRKTEKMLVDSGQVSQKQIEDLRKKYPNYVPLFVKNVDEVVEPPSTLARIRGFIKPLKELGDEVREYENVLETTLERGVSVERDGLMNQVKLSFVNDVRKNPDVYENVVGKPVRRDADYAAKQNVKKGTGEILYKDGGQTYSIEIKNNRLFSMLEQVYVDPDGFLGSLVNGMLKFQKIRQALVTSTFNFQIKASMRDIVSASATAKAMGGSGQGSKYLARSLKAVQDYLDGKRTGDAKFVDEFIKNGGGLGTYVESVKNGNNITKVTGIKQATESYWKQVQKGWYNTNQLIEQPVLVANFMAQRIDGNFSPADAAYIARKSSLDFNMQGKFGKLLKAFSMFGNPKVQGAANLVRIMQSPKALAFLASTAVGGYFAIDAINTAVLGEDWRDYFNDGQLIREMVIATGKRTIINDKGEEEEVADALTMPVDPNMQFFTTMAHRIVGITNGKDEPDDLIWDSLRSLFASLNPIGTDVLAPFDMRSEYDGERFAFAIKAVAGGPIAEALTNRNFFEDEIVPRDKDGKVIPYGEDWRFGDNALDKFIAKVYEFGDKLTKEEGKGIIPDPRVVAHIIDGLSARGGFIREGLETIDGTYNLVKQAMGEEHEPVDLDNLPLVDSVLTTTSAGTRRANKKENRIKYVSKGVDDAEKLLRLRELVLKENLSDSDIYKIEKEVGLLNTEYEFDDSNFSQSGGLLYYRTMNTVYEDPALNELSVEKMNELRDGATRQLELYAKCLEDGGEKCYTYKSGFAYNNYKNIIEWGVVDSGLFTDFINGVPGSLGKIDAYYSANGLELGLNKDGTLSENGYQALEDKLYIMLREDNATPTEKIYYQQFSSLPSHIRSKRVGDKIPYTAIQESLDIVKRELVDKGYMGMVEYDRQSNYITKAWEEDILGDYQNAVEYKSITPEEAIEQFSQLATPELTDIFIRSIQ